MVYDYWVRIALDSVEVSRTRSLYLLRDNEDVREFSRQLRTFFIRLRGIYSVIFDLKAIADSFQAYNYLRFVR